MAKTRYLGDIVSLTPTSFETWARCRRQFLLGHILGVPPSNSANTPDLGQQVHELLRFLHEQGSCHDRTHVEETLTNNGAATELHRVMFERHEARCPETFERAAHEVDVARFHRFPAPMFMAQARIDAIWVHDGLLDARDYKTGRRFYDRVADDPSAQVQAFVLAPYARRRSLRLRLRYEFLAPEVDDDPEPFEPDDDDLEAIGEQLRVAVAAMHNEQDREQAWRGCADAAICRSCRYRAICPDSEAAGVPEWQALALTEEPEGSHR
jgi:hypothetical protein